MQQITLINDLKIHSKFLKRDVIFDVILPPNYENIPDKLSVLYLNDGQDMTALKIESTLNKLYRSNEIIPFVLVAIHTNENRMKEYGTAAMPDYKQRGNLAQQYNDFIINELYVKIVTNYHVSSQKEDNFFAGFSLGGLSAIDIVWANPDKFSKVGVFSGSFWWRKKAYEDGYDDHNDRIMHVLIRNGVFHEGQKFWFECGTNDEKDDRNGNGVIDSIDDTQDLITELINKGYQNGKDISYYEIKEGEHNQQTWSEAMPIFLKWLFGKE
ncbi:alpha/beta hydrolase [Emticicia sp. SJ17W-69]|uniref:alpha/beta hydrolase n=1 Tax=Emticicia sp. SJ17W-69 TaxID=3421657 RepID=UPI003EB6DBD7